MNHLPYTIARADDVSLDERIEAQQQGTPWSRYRRDANGDLWLRRWDSPAIHAEKQESAEVPLLRGVPWTPGVDAAVDDEPGETPDDDPLAVVLERIVALEARVAALEETPADENADNDTDPEPVDANLADDDDAGIADLQIEDTDDDEWLD